jgi:hypothetical protein
VGDLVGTVQSRLMWFELFGIHYQK